MDVNNLPITSNQATVVSFSSKSATKEKAATQQQAMSSASFVSSGETKTQQPVELANVTGPVKIDEQIQDSKDQIEKAMEQIKERTKDMSFSIDMRYDDRINRTIAKIVDKETGNVIKEIPPEELVNVAVMIKDMAEGIIIDNQA